MVFVLDAPITAGSQFGAGLGQGISQGLSSSLDQFFEQQKLAREEQKKDTTLQKFFAGPGKDFSPEEKGLITLSAKFKGLEGIGEKILENRRKAQADKEFRDYVQKTSGMASKTGKSREELTAMASSPNPQIAKHAQNLLENDREEAKLKYKQIQDEEKKRQFAHKETEKYYDSLSTQAERAEEVENAANEIEKIIDKPEWKGKKAENLAYKYLEKKNSPFKDLFLSPDAQTIVSNTKVLMGGGAKEMFGSRPTEREVFWIENVLPGILKSMSTNKASLKYFKRFAQTVKDKKEIAAEITKENGGYRPIDLEDKVAERLKEKLGKLIDEGYKMSDSAFGRTPSGEIKRVPRDKIKEFEAHNGVIIGQ